MRMFTAGATVFAGSAIGEELLAQGLDGVGLAQSDHGVPPRLRGGGRRSGRGGCGRPRSLVRALRRCRPARIKRDDARAPQMGPMAPTLITDLRSVAYFDAEESTAAYAQTTGRRGRSA